MNNNLDATVFVYRHRDTSEVKALYHDSALGMTYQTDYEHVATLEPRMWIEHHFDDAVKERKACAKNTENTDIDGYKPDDFDIVDYKHQQHIKLPVAV